MEDLNEEHRSKRKSTDILSFPANDFESPGVFSEDPFLEFVKHLGNYFPFFTFWFCFFGIEHIDTYFTDVSLMPFMD